MMVSNGSKCPICGKDNGCAFYSGKDPAECWCMTTKVPDELKEIARRNGDGKACICKTCIDRFLECGYITKK